MDATFFQQPYYFQTAIQGKNHVTEHQFREEVAAQSPIPTSIQTESHTHPLPQIQPVFLSPSESHTHPRPPVPSVSLSPSISKTPSKTVQNNEFIVYTRRNKKTQEDNEYQPHSTTVQESDQNSTPTETLSGNTEPKHSEFDDLDLPIAVRKGVRSCTNHPITNFISYEKLSPRYRAFVTSLTDIQIPSSVHEALQKPEWKKAIEDEVCALEKNGTWELTDLPKGKTPVGCKWIFTVKYKANGDIDRFKARLAAKGFTQTYGIKY